MSDSDIVLKEFHHRVKNNFQIIASLINLQKRLLAADRRTDLRFIEEHVQSMAVAYRVVNATKELVSVSVYELVTEVLDSLMHIAGCPKGLLAVELSTAEHPLGLNQAIALSLFLALMVPPYIDRAMSGNGAALHVKLSFADDLLTLIITGDWAAPIELDFLRNRLADGYLRQLNAESLTDLDAPQRGIRFLIESPHRALA
jgi:Histidine kinase